MEEKDNVVCHHIKPLFKNELQYFPIKGKGK